MIKALLSTEDILSMIMTVTRTGWVRLGIYPPETVGDHTFLATCLAIMFCDLNEVPHNEVVPVVLYHDIAEIITGDIPLDVSKMLSNKAELEINAINQLLSDDKFCELKDILISYLKKKSFYTSFIKNTDILATLFQAHMYELIGWKGFVEFWENYEIKDNDRFFISIKDYIKDCNRQCYSFYGNASDIDSYYDNESYAIRHQKILERFPKNVYTEIIHNLVKGMCFEPKIDSVVDIGAGTGRFSEWFRKYGNSTVHSLDINSDLLRCIPENERSKTLKWNISRQWPFADESQDVVLCGEVLEHLFRPDFALKEAYRVLNNNGLIFVSVPDNNHPSRKENILRYGYPEHPEKRRLFEEHIQLFTPSTIIRGLEDSGFKPLVMCWYDLQTGEQSEFIRLNDSSLSDLIEVSLMRHIFIVAKKIDNLNVHMNNNINNSLLLEIVKLLSRAKYMSKGLGKKSIAEEYLIEFSKVNPDRSSKDKYRLLLINCLKDCYLAGTSEVTKINISTIPRLKEVLFGISSQFEFIYSKYLV